MTKEKVKYIIVGQGLVGSWLSYYLYQQKIAFKVIHDPTLPVATKAASGVINPVTGRRIVQTWLIEDILPFAVRAYQQMENELGIPLIQEAPVILLHPSAQMKESFEYRLSHENVFLAENNLENWNTYFATPFGTGKINSCYWMDLNGMLTGWNTILKKEQFMIESHFDMKDLKHSNHGVEWKNLTADYIIFCDGISSMKNPYFKALPFAPNKGEALIVSIPGLPKQHIYKNTISVVPWKKDLFWVGSNYEWHYDNVNPSPAFREKMIAALDSFLQIPYEVVDHITGIRPANTERRPFVGMHPSYPSLGICNGMGTKGCSLAPYFTHQLVAHLEKGLALHPEADIQRFVSLLQH